MRRGFSLAELMIAFSLSVFLIILLWYFFSQTGYSAEVQARKQGLMDVSSRFLRVLKKDVRSATEAEISSKFIKLKINRLSEESGVPETAQVEYEIFPEKIVRDDGQKTIYSFSSFRKNEKDYLSLDIIRNSQNNSGVFLEIFAVSDGGVEMIHVKERLLKIDMTNEKK
ncbi:MAG: PulJ/GspJ family protein [Candidatus Rifleibacteriota bacterium]